jgi:hypothetical protein
MFEKNIKKHVNNLEANEFLNKLVKIGIYPNADQTLVFLETGDVNVLTEFFSEDGPVNVLTDPKRTLQIQGLIRSYNEIKTKEETKAEAEEEEGEEKKSKTEEDIDAILGDVDLDGMPGAKTVKKTKVMTEDESSSPFGKSVLIRLEAVV